MGVLVASHTVLSLPVAHAHVDSEGNGIAHFGVLATTIHLQRQHLALLSMLIDHMGSLLSYSIAR